MKYITYLQLILFSRNLQRLEVVTLGKSQKTNIGVQLKLCDIIRIYNVEAIELS